MPTKRYVIGMDVGGTKIAAGVVSPSGKIVHSVRVATEQHRSARRVLKNMSDAIASCMNAYPVRAIGIGITGAVDPERGISYHSSNLPSDWKDVPLARLLNKQFRVPVVIDNDANVIGLAEARWGKAQKARTAFVITIGTGIGSAYLTNGEVLHGKTGQGPEFGHTTISSRAVRCSCGHMGHFEALVSGVAMENLYHQRTKKRKSTYEIIAEARDGKKDARAVLEDMRQSLGVGLANALHAFNPDVLIVGGGLAHIRFLTKDLKNLVRRHLIAPKRFGKIPIVKSYMIHTAGILGGAALTMTPKKR